MAQGQFTVYVPVKKERDFMKKYVAKCVYKNSEDEGNRPRSLSELAKVAIHDYIKNHPASSL